MTYPSNLKYTKDHEWLIASDGKTALIGVTAYAVEQLGDIVHLELPKEGDMVSATAPFGTIESTKTVSDLYAPVSGKITAVNQALKNSLESLANDPYEKSWLVKIEMSKTSELSSLLSSSQYESFISEQAD